MVDVALNVGNALVLYQAADQLQGHAVDLACVLRGFCGQFVDQGISRAPIDLLQLFWCGGYEIALAMHGYP